MTARDLLDATWARIIERAAVIATPVVASLLVWFGSQWLDARFSKLADALTAVVSRVEALEKGLQDDHTMLQNHETRLVVGAGELAQTGKIADKTQQQLDEISNRLAQINDSVTALRTIINERVPRKQASTNSIGVE